MTLLNSLMTLADVYSWLSQDAETQVGCILVNREKGEVIVSGVNRFIEDTKGLPNTRPSKYKYIQHAEMRLIYQAAKEGIKTNNCILICTHSPCVNCALALFQAGIDTIYFKEFRNETERINDRLDLKANLKKLKSGYYKLKLSLRERI